MLRSSNQQLPEYVTKKVNNNQRRHIETAKVKKGLTNYHLTISFTAIFIAKEISSVYYSGR